MSIMMTTSKVFGINQPTYQPEPQPQVTSPSNNEEFDKLNKKIDELQAYINTLVNKNAVEAEVSVNIQRTDVTEIQEQIKKAKKTIEEKV